MKYDVIIIGSGLGGLVCGYILAKQGRRVLLLEQGAQPGGCLQSYRRRGMAFDTGFHYVGGLDEGQSLHAAFRHLGLLDLPWHRLDPDGFDRVTLGNRTYHFPTGFDQFASQMAAYFPSERMALYEYAALLKRVSQHQFASLNPQGDPDTSFTCKLMETGAWNYLTRQFSHPTLIQILSGTSLKMELRKETLPLFTFLYGNSCYIESSWRLKGDSSLIVNKLIAGIRAQGGEIICRARVDQLVEQQGKLTTAVCANGARYEGDFFISDIHPAQTCQLVQESRLFKPAYRHRIHQLENTFGMFTVSLRIRPRHLGYFNYNHYIYLQETVWDPLPHPFSMNGLLISCRVPEDGSDYTRQIDLLTPMQWEWCMPWQHTHVGKRDKTYHQIKSQFADRCLRLADRLFPGLKEQSQCFTSTPLTWRDYTLTPEGTAYGLRKDFRNPLLTMLSPRTPVPNLFLTGQNLMVHGIHGVTMTAFYTCAEILGKEAIWKTLHP